MLALALSCVINNLCVEVQRLKSVSVFIKMSFTIFTASPRYLLSVLPVCVRVRVCGVGVFVFVQSLTVKTECPTGVSLVPGPG